MVKVHPQGFGEMDAAEAYSVSGHSAPGLNLYVGSNQDFYVGSNQDLSSCYVNIDQGASTGVGGDGFSIGAFGLGVLGPGASANT